MGGHGVAALMATPTLFEKLRGNPAAMRHPRIIDVLAVFGHQNQFEIAQAAPSKVRDVALNMIAGL